MVKLIKIGSDLFPDRYKKYTNFIASYGAIAVYQDVEANISDISENILYLDGRYNISAKKAGIKFDSLKNIPRINVILDPFEWSIAEIKNFGFKDIKFVTRDILKSKINISIEDKLAIMEFLKNYNKKYDRKFCYLISNTMYIKEPTIAMVIDEDGQIKKLDQEYKNDILFDSYLTCAAYLEYVSLENSITDPIRASQSIMKDIEPYEDFLLIDSSIWIKFWRIVEENYKNMREIDAADLLNKIKYSIFAESYKPAFETIVGNNENAAAIHGYASSKILEDGILLVDAGSNIKDFNSDITRVFMLGDNISEDIKNSYTKTLKAHIAVATNKSREKMIASELDALARNYVQFDHALGHGVGKKVHAFPTISASSKEYLEPNMILAIEPGVYYPGKFGIRLESLMQVIYEKGEYKLKYLIDIPFEHNLIDFAQLCPEEIKWLSNFHKICYKKLIAKGLLDNFDIEFLNKKVGKFIHEL